MRAVTVMFLAVLVLLAAGLARADEDERAPVTLAPPEMSSYAGFTLVDWINGLAFDLDPQTRASVQPHCNLMGGFILQWPEADYDCDPEAVFEPAYELDISVYHSYILEQESAEEGWEMLPVDDIDGQARLNELQAVQMAGAGRELAGQARVKLPDGAVEVPYYTWQSGTEDETRYCLEYVVLQPGAGSGAQLVTVSLYSTNELSEELIELATARLRMFEAMDD